MKQKVELLHRSSNRMMEMLDLPRDKKFWKFFRREWWVHFKRTMTLLPYVIRRRE